VAVTRDAGLVASLRRDRRVDLVAHLEDPILAGAVVESLAVDAVLVDHDLADRLGAFAGRSPEICVIGARQDLERATRQGVPEARHQIPCRGAPEGRHQARCRVPPEAADRTREDRGRGRTG